MYQNIRYLKAPRTTMNRTFELKLACLIKINAMYEALIKNMIICTVHTYN